MTFEQFVLGQDVEGLAHRAEADAEGTGDLRLVLDGLAGAQVFDTIREMNSSATCW